MNDTTGALVLAITAATMLAAGRMIGGRVQTVLVPMAVNVAAVACIFAAFAYSLDVGIDVRPVAKAVDGAAALTAAAALHRWID
ncbi:MAG: hypothetical protein GY871_09590 [Actinomycetales bacterium]|nr:hypothetical protein [Actinomycetales bacterium]